MKKGLIICLSLLMLVGCQNETTEKDNVSSSDSNEVTPTHTQGKSIVAYFTRVGNTDFPDDVDMSTLASLNLVDNKIVGNTEYIANIIAEEKNCEQFLIQTKDKYPVDYDDVIDQGEEEKSQNLRPELTSHIDNINEIDTIYLGFPNWWYTMPMPVYSFLEEYDFSGKNIIVFCTSGGSGFSDTISEIQDICSRANVVRGYTVNGNDALESYDDIIAWLKSV